MAHAKQQRILVVCDDPEYRMLIARILERDFTVTSLESFDGLHERLVEEGFALIVCGTGLVGRSQVEPLVLALKGHNDAPVLFVVGHRDGYVHADRIPSAIDCVHVPFEAEELLSAASNLIDDEASCTVESGCN